MEESRNRGETGSFKSSPLKNPTGKVAVTESDDLEPVMVSPSKNTNAFAESVIIRSGQRLVANRGSSRRNLLYKNFEDSKNS